MTQIFCTSGLFGNAVISDGTAALFSVIAGDLTLNGSEEELQAFQDQHISGQRMLLNKFGKLLFIAGQHDINMARKSHVAAEITRLSLPNTGATSPTYLEESSEFWNGYSFYGTPYHRADRGVFSLRSDAEAEKYWEDLHLAHVNVLITYEAPAGIVEGGCPHLRKMVDNLKPIVHIFGRSHGTSNIGTKLHPNAIFPTEFSTQFINASSCPGDFKPGKGQVWTVAL